MIVSPMATSRACLTAALLAVTAPSQDWLRFRGPNGSGIAENKAALVEIGADTAPAWRVEVPFARSSPIVVGDLVVMTASDEEHLLVQAIRTADGSTAWTRQLVRARKDDRYAGNDSASPSPTSDGTSVYAFFPELGLVAFALDGEPRWTLGLDAFDSFYGMSSSPIVVDGRLLLQCDQEGGSFLLAVDAASGEIVWRTPRDGFGVGWSTPIVRAAEGDRQAEVLVVGSRHLVGYALDDGRELWRGSRLGSGPVCSPVCDGARVFVSMPNHAETPLPEFKTVAADLDKDEDGRLTKAEVGESELGQHFGWIDDDEDGVIVEAEWTLAREDMMNKDYGLVCFELGDDGALSELWRQRRALPEIATPLAYRGTVYALKHGGILSAIDAATGKVLNRGRVGDVVEEFNASPIAADGHLYLASAGGKLVTLEAGPEFEVRAVRDLDEMIDATPAVGSDGALYLRTRAALYRFR